MSEQDRVGEKMANEAINLMKGATKDAEKVQNQINSQIKGQTERQATERSKKLMKEKLLKDKNLSGALKKNIEKTTEKTKATIRTAASKARQAMAKSIGDAAAVPTAGVSKVAGDATAKADKKITESRNEKAKSKVEEKSADGGRITGQVKQGIKKQIPGMELTDAKGLTKKLSGLDKLGKNDNMAIVTGKNAVRDSLKRDMSSQNKENER